MSHHGAQTLGKRCCRLVLMCSLAMMAGGAMALPEAGPGEMVIGAKLKSGPAPLPELMPFQANLAATAAPAATEAPAADSGAAAALSAKELLLAAAAVLAFVVLRFRD